MRLQDELARYLEAQWSSLEKSNAEARSNEDARFNDEEDSFEDDRLRTDFYVLSSISTAGSARCAHLA